MSQLSSISDEMDGFHTPRESPASSPVAQTRLAFNPAAQASLEHFMPSPPKNFRSFASDVFFDSCAENLGDERLGKVRAERRFGAESKARAERKSVKARISSAPYKFSHWADAGYQTYYEENSYQAYYEENRFNNPYDYDETCGQVCLMDGSHFWPHCDTERWFGTTNNEKQECEQCCTFMGIYY